MKRSLAALLAAASLVATHPAMAAGFSVYEWDAWGVALGEAMMFSDSPSLVGYNPAGITRFGREGVWTTGTVRISPVGTANFYENGKKVATTDNLLDPAYVPYGYFARQVDTNLWFGLSLYPRFGLSAKFPSDFMGRFSNYLAEFKTMSLAANFAWKVAPSLSFSLGGELMYADLKIGQTVPLGPSAESRMDLHGESWNTGWNAALNWQATPKLSLAMVYRSKVKQTMNHATTTFSDPRTGAPLPAIGQGSVTLPDSWTFGVGWKFDDRTRVELDAIYTRWSSYDALTIAFDRFWPLAFARGLPHAPAFTTTSAKHWENGWRYQFGLEHKFDDHWTGALGVVWDKDVSPDAYADFMVPVSDRITYSTGVRYTNKNISWALSFGYMDIRDKRIDDLHYPGRPNLRSITTDNYATVIGLTCRVQM